MIKLDLPSRSEKTAVVHVKITEENRDWLYELAEAHNLPVNETLDSILTQVRAAEDNKVKAKK